MTPATLRRVRSPLACPWARPAGGLPLPELPQAAVSSPAPSATKRPAPSLTVAGGRIPADALIVTVSRLLAFFADTVTTGAA